MPVLPEEDEDSPEEIDSSSSSPSTYTPLESRAVTMTMPAPTIVFPKQTTVTVVQTDSRPLEQTRPHSPRPRLSRISIGGPITTVDSTGNVIDLVKDPLPELQLSEEDRQKNLELLEEAKKVSDRFLTRRGRRSTCSLSESPTGLSPNQTPSSSPVPSRSSSLTTAPQIRTSTFLSVADNIHVYKNLTEHKLMRNQSIVGSMLPDLSETAEQERGPSPLPSPGSPTDEEAKEKSDAMPNISDIMLRKLKLHRGLPVTFDPLFFNAFVQLSLAFRNDNYTLETRLKQAERERTLTEENTEKELEEFKNSLKVSPKVWSNMEQRESYQRLIETVAVLHRLATRLSSRAEMVGAVRQEKRMNKATEVMMQYVENLKRTYEKDHAELTEFKKLANQNSNRCYGGSIDTGGRNAQTLRPQCVTAATKWCTRVE
uniref:Murine retrovirus integration site 1 homolog n=1 Tax=Esox lucius TaxID=8010 RepID=A0A3P9A5T6_ESOLU